MPQDPTPSPGALMRAETAEIPAAVARMLEASTDGIASAGRLLADLDPPVIATIARGSSDNAASFFKYACEITAGVPVASVGPSIASIYGRRLRLAGAVAVTISQGGRSPDLLASIEAVRNGGGRSIGIVNTEGSPLANAVDVMVPVRAGREHSVAATKSFVSSAVAGLAILAAWTKDEALKQAIADLPRTLSQALAVDCTPVVEALRDVFSIYVLGRGPGFAMAQEASLKLKETSGVHAEAFSSAEVHHGPASLVGSDFPVLALLVEDAAAGGMRQTIETLAGRGARVFAMGGEARGAAERLAIPSTGHPLTDPIAHVTAFYKLAEELAVRRGQDPDRPPHLLKLTDTV